MVQCKVLLQHKGNVWESTDPSETAVMKLWGPSLSRPLGYNWVRLAIPQTSGNLALLDGKPLLRVREKEVA